MNTRENMSPELKKEMESIELQEHSLMVSEYVKSSVGLTSNLYTDHYPESKKENEFNPFHVEFFWDEPEFGKIAELDIREDLLDRFKDDPEHFKWVIIKTEKAMRDFADELKVMSEKLNAA